MSIQHVTRGVLDLVYNNYERHTQIKFDSSFQHTKIYYL